MAKAFLQLAFHQCRFKPKGLRSFMYGDFYDEIVDGEVTQEMLDDWGDEEVLPWCRAARSVRTHAQMDEYYRRQAKVYFGI
jgi:hypothetical protein